MARLVFAVPGKDEPGFLLRLRQTLEFRERMRREATPETVDALVKFLAGFVEEPEEVEEREKALWKASEAELMGLLDALTGAAVNPTMRGGD